LVHRGDAGGEVLVHGEGAEWREGCYRKKNNAEGGGPRMPTEIKIKETGRRLKNPGRKGKGHYAAAKNI